MEEHIEYFICKQHFESKWKRGEKLTADEVFHMAFDTEASPHFLESYNTLKDAKEHLNDYVSYVGTRTANLTDGRYIWGDIIYIIDASCDKDDMVSWLGDIWEYVAQGIEV